MKLLSLHLLLSQFKGMKSVALSFCILLLLAVSPVCSQTLSLTQDPTWLNLGDLDVPGNQITVEALIYRDGFSTINIVSKHSFPDDVNYLLRPQTFELTTYVSGNSGATQFLQMANPFTMASKTWYHIAGTYDGSFVRYYVNGCLVIEKPFSGNLFQNDLPAAIGNQSTNQAEQFLGKMDEVRIWNICRTQEQIAANMLDLPNPSTQAGLIAYYKFENDFTNSQGNAIWNGTPVGNLFFAPSQIDLPSFEITGIATTNSDCSSLHNGTITITTNRPNSTYSIDGVNYQSSGVFNDVDAGTYTIYVRSPEGCIIDSIATVIGNNISFPVALTRIICSGENYLGYTSTGIYVDTIKTAGSCDTIRTLNLTVHPSYHFSDAVTLCPGDVYDFHGTFLSASGTYTAAFLTSKGCDSIYTLELTVLPGTFLPDDTLLCIGSSYEIVSSSAATLWFDNTVSPTKTVTSTGWYWATIKDATGCDVTDSIYVQFNTKYFVPNAFTPDGNGINDVFAPVLSGTQLKNYQLFIFDRWGKQLFASDDPADSWDGTYLGKICSVGTYIYYLSVESGTCEKVVTHGYVNLLK